jgi:hypothetical protein
MRIRTTSLKRKRKKEEGRRKKKNVHWNEIAELSSNPLTTGTNSPSGLMTSLPVC